jgi:endonuclease/exonuclease/phosphatase family metal-dependent hydrolase
VATFNASLHRERPGALLEALRDGRDPQIAALTEIVAAVDPDILLLCEVDHDATDRVPLLLRKELVTQGGAWRDHFAPVTNTGVPSGFDLDRDGVTEGPGDALGYGTFEGQYGMLLLSRHPILHAQIRCLGDVRWAQMPKAWLPDDASTPAPADWFTPQALAVLPISSKNHCDVPVQVGDTILHLLISHPTPPVFDGPEDRNGRRNHDEIRLWNDYLEGQHGGLEPAASFVILGDLNADPHDGDASGQALPRLLSHPRVRGDLHPRSPGAVVSARAHGGRNAEHHGPAALDTTELPPQVGNLRLDYVLPSRDLEVAGSGVYWPLPGEAGATALRFFDHRPVWIDLALAP